MVSDVHIDLSGRMVYYAKHYKFFYNFYPFLFLAAAIAGARMMRRRWPGMVVWVLLAGLVGLGARSLVMELAHGRPSLAPRYPSHDLARLGRTLGGSCRLPAGIERCGRMRGHWRAECLVGVGGHATGPMLGEKREGEPDLDPGSCTCSAFDPHDRPLCARGVGKHLAWYRLMDIDAAVKDCRAMGVLSAECLAGYMENAADLYYNLPDDELHVALSALGPEARGRLAQGMGIFLASRFGSDPAFMLDRCSRLERGFGLAGCDASAARYRGRYEALHPDGARAFESLPGRLRAHYWRGYGEMLAWATTLDPGGASGACLSIGEQGDAGACLEGARHFEALMDTGLDKP
jgi:hypothetical protein